MDPRTLMLEASTTLAAGGYGEPSLITHGVYRSPIISGLAVDARALFADL